MSIQLSVIIPTYNCGTTITRAIDSVLSQNVLECEIIIVDDGSNDHTGDIVKRYIKPNGGIRYVKTENNGVSAARNTGIKLAKGKYIGFLDADDAYEDNVLLKMLMEVVGFDMIVFNYSEYYENGLVVRHKQPNLEETGNTIIEKFFQYASQAQLFSPCNKLYRLGVISQNKILFNTNRRIGEDIEFNLKFISKMNNGRFICADGYKYFRNSKSIMHSYSPDFFTAQVELLNLIYEFKPDHTLFEREFLVKRIYYVFQYGRNNISGFQDRYQHLRKYVIQTRFYYNYAKVKSRNLLYNLPVVMIQFNCIGILYVYLRLVHDYIKIKQKATN